MNALKCACHLVIGKIRREEQSYCEFILQCKTECKNKKYRGNAIIKCDNRLEEWDKAQLVKKRNISKAVKKR